MTKRILLLNVELSGVNKYIISGLKKRGWEIICIDVSFPKICRWLGLLFTFHPNLKLWKHKFNNKLEKLHKSSWVFILRTKYCQKLVSKFRDKFDIIFQVSGMFAPSLDLKQLDKPYVTFNDYTMALSNKYEPWALSNSERCKYLFLERELYKNASASFVTSENTKKSFIDDYGIDSRKVLNVGYGLTLEQESVSVKDYNSKIALFVGLDFERKGGYILLQAFRKVKEELPNAKLMIVGPKKQILNIKQPGVEVLGEVRDKSKLRRLYLQASLFVMPSLCEPFGLVFLEAMANKLPCIGTNIDAMPEIILDGKTGFLVPPQNTDILAIKLITILSNVELAKKMGEEGYKRVKENFSWDNIIKKIDVTLESILHV